MSMIACYLKSAVRNILRYKGYSFINIIGLAIGLAGSLIVFLWVFDEIRFDSFHTNADSLYRCYRKVVWNGEQKYNEATSMPIAPTLKERVPGIGEFTRTTTDYTTLTYQTESTHGSVLYADPNFLTVFTFPLIEGNPHKALSEPNSVILTHESAVRLFGTANPVGEILDDGSIVTGIVENIPHNSTIEFDFLMPLARAERDGIVQPDEWWDFGMDTYFLIENNIDINEIHTQIRNLYAGIDSESNIELLLQPFKDMHLRNLDGGGRIVYVYIFSIVAALLLLVACINFMNLTTARAAKRATEIGLRKAIGARRSQLIAQLFVESTLQSAIAAALAVCILELLLPMLTGFLGKELVFTYSAETILIMVAVILITALLAGSYPALVLSAYRPATALKKVSTGGSKSTNTIRKGLVVFQFAVSTGLIFSALVINGQMQHINNRDLGINHEHIVELRIDELDRDYAAIKSELLKYSGIKGVTCVYAPPVWCGWYMTGFDFDGREEGQDIRTGVSFIDYEFVDVFGLEVVQGRNFSREYSTDEHEGFLVNEAAVRAMHMDSPVGKNLTFLERTGKIIGVTKDFHFSSLHHKIAPLIMTIDSSYYRRLCIKIDPEDIPGSLNHITANNTKFRPGREIGHRFLTDLIDRGYAIEIRTGSIILAFTVLAVLIAGLGLFGLAAYSAERRTREIGIRRVLGSSVTGIVSMLTREFIILVIIGGVIATPLAYYLTGRWLDGFAYRIGIGPSVFLIAGLLTVAIALAAVGQQAIRAARANPTKALKYE